jgi:FtsZ-binding cell division protein ZapB
MAECRHLLCLQPAEFEVTVRYFGGVRERKALYCTEHLTRVQEALATRETSEITNIRPLKGTTVTENQIPLTANEEISNLKAALTLRDLEIGGLRLEVEGAVGQVEDRDQKIANLESVNADLKRDVAAADAAIGRLKDNNHSLREEITGYQKRQEALVSSLHALADNAEDEGRQDLAEEVDALLAEHNLKPRKQEYTIEILVPTRLHLHVTARSMNHARTLYEAGDIDWNVADGEVQDDDIKVLDISEGSL